MIKEGNVERMPEDIFKTEITTRIINFMSGSPRSVVIMVPHQRDLLNSHMAYPQSPFAKASFGLPSKVSLVFFLARRMS